MKEIITTNRIRIDAILLAIPGGVAPSREVSAAFTSLQLAGMFMGKIKGDLGETAYPESRDPTSLRIDEREDTAPEPLELPAVSEEDASKYDHQIRVVKFLRKEIKDIGDGILSAIFESPALKFQQRKDAVQFDRHMDTMLNHLEASGMWFGQQLNNLR